MNITRSCWKKQDSLKRPMRMVTYVKICRHWQPGCSGRWINYCPKDILLKAVNFSTYGASFVHINREGKPVTPLYNYLKNIRMLYNRNFIKVWREITFSMHTASPVQGSLNWVATVPAERTAKQLFWKYITPASAAYCFCWPAEPIPILRTAAASHVEFSAKPLSRMVAREGISEKLALYFSVRPGDEHSSERTATAVWCRIARQVLRHWSCNSSTLSGNRLKISPEPGVSAWIRLTRQDLRWKNCSRIVCVIWNTVADR